MNCHRLLTANKKISIYPAASPGGAVVYLNTAAGEGGQVYDSLLSSGCPDYENRFCSHAGHDEISYN